MRDPRIADRVVVDVTSIDGATTYARTVLGSFDGLLPHWLFEIIHEEGRLVLRDHEAGRLMGVSRGSIRAAIAENEIQVVRLGRRLLIPVVPLLHSIGVDLLSERGSQGPVVAEDPTRSMGGLS